MSYFVEATKKGLVGKMGKCETLGREEGPEGTVLS